MPSNVEFRSIRFVGSSILKGKLVRDTLAGFPLVHSETDGKQMTFSTKGQSQNARQNFVSIRQTTSFILRRQDFGTLYRGSVCAATAAPAALHQVMTQRRRTDIPFLTASVLCSNFRSLFLHFTLQLTQMRKVFGNIFQPFASLCSQESTPPRTEISSAFTFQS